MAVTRRQLLVLGCGTVLGCGGGADLPLLVPAGNIGGLPQGTVRAVSGVPLAIGRDQGGVYALSLLCTHAGCDISQDGSVGAGSIECFCHGSVFSGTGEVLRGPATEPLPHFAVSEDAAGALTIHTDQPTPASTRLPA
jgi:Rieske Fe-S protein